MVGHLAPPPAGLMTVVASTQPLFFTEARWWRTTPNTTCRTTGCSTNSAPLGDLPCRIRLVTSMSRWSSARTSGSAPVRSPSWDTTAGGLLCDQRQPVRAEQGRRARGSVLASGPGTRLPVAYVNMWGGQDELVFDGDSMVVAADGTVLARARSSSIILVADLDLPPQPPRPMSCCRCAATTGTEPGDRRSLSDREVYLALVTGLRDYVRKKVPQRCPRHVGRIDSALVAAIACDALGARRTSTASDAQ